MSLQVSKVIFKGRFDFGSQEAVARIVKQLEPRMLTLYKEDFPWKLEHLFPEGAEQVVFQPVSMQIAERTWKHGLDALGWLGHFALCGEVLAIRLGPDRSSQLFRPEGQKAAVLLYRHACEETNPQQRLALLDQVLAKYPLHTEALMARADLAMGREDLAAAWEDLHLADSRDGSNPALRLRKARHHAHQGKWVQALEEGAQAMSLSMPLEDIHWESRHLKALAHRALAQYDDALQECHVLSVKLEKTPGLLPGLLEEITRVAALCRTEAAAALDQVPA